MPSLKNTLFVATAALFAGVKADYVISPDSVDQATRDYWCQQELATCPLICQQTEPGTTLVNDCDADALTYGCICGDGKQPNVSEYSLTLPYFTCVEWGNQCQKACGSDNTCASACREDHPCGALKPTTQNETDNATSTASSTASATASDGVVTGLAGGDGSKSDSGAAAIAFGRSYGLAVVAGGLFAGFTLML